jgi:hypothetical protein
MLNVNARLVTLLSQDCRNCIIYLSHGSDDYQAGTIGQRSIDNQSQLSTTFVPNLEVPEYSVTPTS